MRFALLLILLTACGSQETAQTPPTPDTGVDVFVAPDVQCGGACGPGTVCEQGRCVVADAGVVDAPTDDRAATASGAPQDAAEDRPVTVDVLVDTGPTCPTGETLCAGRCANTMTDRDNCGGCDMHCGTGDPSRHLVFFCASGRCTSGCESHWGDCDRMLPNGCETTLRREGNCGTCGTMCTRSQSCAGAGDGGAYICVP